MNTTKNLFGQTAASGC